MTSQCDTAPSRPGAKASAAREDGAALAKSSTTISNCAEIAFCRADRALHDGKFVDADRLSAVGFVIITVTSRCSLSRCRGLDRLLVAAVNQNYAFAGERHDRSNGCRHGGGRKQRGHLRAGLSTL